MMRDEPPGDLEPFVEKADVQEQEHQTLDELIEEQNTEAQQFAIDFLKKVIRLRGVRIDRGSYGWKDFLGDLDDVDDETLSKVTIFLGVMLGVSGAANGLTLFAHRAARPALQKQIAKQALTKTGWYPTVKRVLMCVGVKVTKDSFAKTVTKAVPVAGGVVSGGMTLVSLKIQSTRLQSHLRKLPPPGVDAAAYLAELEALDEGAGEMAAVSAFDPIADGAGVVASN